MLGLFGISLFDIRQRRKEIAIRKINGAQIIDIIRLLLKKYFALLTLAFAASIPVALFAIHKYLENFANKASISWWLFAVALAVTLAISLLTLLYQTYKAGNENPADVIKSDV
jgi:ABC-type antimicrobial peptide transport system permease subunit